ncbi:MAG: DUF3592 domain-containing protein [Desulfuromonadales bacterium]|nr:DUF3592 domain-containing protein [Desulfuromonadales bacterium]
MVKVGQKVMNIGWVAFVLMAVSAVIAGFTGNATIWTLFGVLFVVSVGLILIGIFMMVFLGESKGVKNGILVMGELISIEQTDQLVNYQPMCKLTLQFTTKDGQQVTGSDIRVIQMVDLAQYQPGIELPVRYNPKKPQNIMIDVNADSNSFTKAVEQFTGITEQVKNGPLVAGKVISVRPTDTSISGTKMYEVSIQFITEDGQKITGTAKQAIQDDSLPQLQQPDMVFPLRYDPNNPQNIMIEQNADPKEVRKAADKYFVAMGLKTQTEVNIRENGTHTTGVILASKPTGNIVNGMSEMELTVCVTRPNNGGQYDVTTIKNVTQSALSSTAPGNIVQVYYMPGDEQNIYLGYTS